MPLRLFYFESDNAADAVQLASALIGRTTVIDAPAVPAPAVTVESPAALPAPTRKPRRAARLIKPKPAAPPVVRRLRTPTPGGPRDKAEAILRKAGKPMRRAEVARQAGIPNGSATAAFRDPRFVVTPDGLLWLADQDDPRDEADDDEDDEESEPEEFEDKPPPPASAATTGKREGAPTTAELKQAIRSCGPLDLKEIACFTEFSEAACFRALQAQEFERDTDGLYWIK